MQIGGFVFFKSFQLAAINFRTSLSTRFSPTAYCFLQALAKPFSISNIVAFQKSKPLLS